MGELSPDREFQPVLNDVPMIAKTAFSSSHLWRIFPGKPNHIMGLKVVEAGRTPPSR